MKKKKEEKRKKGRKGGRREANPHCRPQRQTREQNLGELSLRNPYNEPQEFSPGSRSPKHQVQPPRVWRITWISAHVLHMPRPHSHKHSSHPSYLKRTFSFLPSLLPCWTMVLRITVSPHGITKCYPWCESSGDHGKMFKTRSFGCLMSPTLQS